MLGRAINVLVEVNHPVLGPPLLGLLASQGNGVVCFRRRLSSAQLPTINQVVMCVRIMIPRFLFHIVLLRIVSWANTALVTWAIALRVYAHLAVFQAEGNHR